MSRGKSSTEDPDRIDDVVRRAYEGFLNEDLPERFIVLLEKLRNGEFPQNEPPTEGQS